MELNSIEMAVVAEVDLEMARAYEEVAADATQRPETREAASEAAARWRERARLNRLEARRRTDEPMIPSEHPAFDRFYTGPERRKRERRRGERRGNGLAETGKLALVGPDRRVNPDRRMGDRRQSDRRR